MRLTLADIEFAKEESARRKFPTLQDKYNAQQKAHRLILFAPERPRRTIHDVINGHARPLTGPFLGINRKLKKRYVWNNTLWIIRERMKRGEAWRGRAYWSPGGGSEEHITLMGRVSRRLRKAEGRIL